MGDCGEVASNNEAKPELPTMSESVPQEETARNERVLQPTIDSMPKKMTNTAKRSGRTPTVSDNDVLKICRPMFVNLVRLPNAPAAKSTVTSEPKRKRSLYMWRRGYSGSHRRRKFLQQKRLHALREKAALALSGSSADDKSAGDGEKPPASETSSNAIAGQVELAPDQAILSENFVSPNETTATDENAARESEEPLEVPELVVEEQISPNSPASELVSSPVEASPQKMVETNPLEASEMFQDHSAPASHQDSVDAVVEAAETLKSSFEPPEQNNNQIQRRSLRKFFEQVPNTAMPAPLDTRKRRSQSADPKFGQSHGLPAKRRKPSANYSGGKDSRDPGNGSESIENAAPIAKQAADSAPSRCDPKFVRRRRKRVVNNIFVESSVVLCRLEDSQDPLVLRWNALRTLEASNVDVQAPCATSPAKDRLACKETSKTEEAVAGVPIAGLEDPSEEFDTERRLGEPQSDFAAAISKENVPALLGVDAAISKTREEPENSQDEDDDEIVHILSRKKTSKSLTDSLSTTSSISSEEIVPSRILRSKTPLANKSILEKLIENREPKEFPLLALRARAHSSEGSNASASLRACKDGPKSPPRRRAKTPSPRKKFLADTTTGALTSDSSIAGEDARRLLPVRRKSFRSSTSERADIAIGVNGAPTHLALEDDTSDSISTSVCRENEAESTDESATNVAAGKSSNFVNCGTDHEDEEPPESLAEANSDLATGNSVACNDEVLMARRKLTATKNAMVVLTRLESLDGLGDGNKYSGHEAEFRSTGDFEYSASCTPDPLEIRGDDSEKYLRDGKSTSSFSTLARRTLGVEASRPSVESCESEVELGLEIEEASSRGTAESDVEMTLVLEENSCRESDDESPSPRNEGDAARHETESPEVVLIDADKSAEPRNDQTTNSTRTPRIQSVRSLRESVRIQGNRAEPRETVGEASSHRCAACENAFEDAEALESHKSANTLCGVGFLCNACRAMFGTLGELARHRMTCASRETGVPTTAKPTETQKSSENTVERLTRVDRKKPHAPKGPPRRTHTKNRPRVDNLVCAVCSVTFSSTQTLSEHIFKHNTQELQEAYRIARVKALEDSQATSAVGARQIDKTPSEPSERVSEKSDASLARDRGDDLALPITTVTRAGSDALTAKFSTVCSCHRDDKPAHPDKQDLQIEMVLLCQQCTVIFRRRECFEIHYRTSPGCAADRTRGRVPKLYCANCQSTLNSWAGMRRHLEFHARLNVDGTVRFVCNICRVVFVGFGALFYNHWANHLRNAMYVSSRHSFPKNSVQPIEGVPKLPIGASPNESYILVAEHVCPECKKPFATRRDLELHEKSKSCVAKDQVPGAAQPTESQWHCDACSMSFVARRGLNHHSNVKHGQRYLCVATSPTFQAFMCTRCFVMKKTVREIEDHWKTQPQHDVPLSFSETLATTKRFASMQTANEKIDKSVKQVLESLTTDASKSGATASPQKNSDNLAPVIDIADDAQTEVDCVDSRAAEKSPETLATCVHSPLRMALTSASPGTPTNTTMVYNVLRKYPRSRKIREEQAAPTPELGKSHASVALEDATRADVSGELMIDESEKGTMDEIDDEPSVKSCEIIMTRTTRSGASANFAIDQTDESAKSATNESDRSATDNTDKDAGAEIDDEPSEKSCTIIMTGTTRHDVSADSAAAESGESAKSAKNVSDENAMDTRDEGDDEPSVESYKIIKTSKSAPGDMKMTLGRLSIARKLHPEDAETSSNLSTATTLSATESGGASTDTDLPVKSNAISTSSPAKPSGAGTNSSSESSRTSRANQANLALKNRPPVPEVIDISEDKEPEQPVPPATAATLPNPKCTANKLSAKSIAGGKSEAPKARRTSPRFSSPSKASSLNNSDSSGCSKTFAFSPNTSEMSFEELRLQYLLGSQQPSSEESATVKKPGFLRVKNLSELQAVKTHTCQLCNAAFESYASLEEHRQVHAHLTSGTDLQCPRGMSAALVLPENPKTAPQQTLPAVYATGNVVTQQLIGLDPATGVLSGVPVSGVIVNNETAGSWISVASQPITTVAVVNNAHSLSGGTLVMNLNGQQTTVSNNTGAIMATSVAAPTATIAQTQKIFATNQQLQQPQQRISLQPQQQISLQPQQQISLQPQQQISLQPQQQISLQPQQQISLQPQQQISLQPPPPLIGVNQQLAESYNTSQLGFHVLPAMVLPPTAQDKQRHSENPLRNAPTPNLTYNGRSSNVPISCQTDRPNRYLCNICTSFRCNSIGTMNSHVMKHYTGFHGTSNGQNSMQPPPRSMSNNPTYIAAKEGNGQGNALLRAKPGESNANGSIMRNNWFMKNTPQGIVWVTSLAAVADQQTEARNAQDSQTAAPSPSQQGDLNVVRGGQVVYRCLICKSAMYKAYSPFRNHVVHVHGITDFIAVGMDNIVQKIYLCTHCPHATTMYDSEEALRRHLASCHDVCRNCGRAFVSNMSLKAHLGYCGVPPHDPRNPTGSSC